MIDSVYPVLSPDLRGHGESQWSPNGSYELDDYIGDLSTQNGQFKCSTIASTEAYPVRHHAKG